MGSFCREPGPPACPPVETWGQRHCLSPGATLLGGGRENPTDDSSPSSLARPIPGTSSQRPCMSPLSALLLENLFLATTNPTPQPCLSRTGPAPTDRSAALPPASALLTAGSRTRAPRAAPRAATCPLPPTGAAPGSWLWGRPVEPGPPGPPWGPAVRQPAHRRPPLRLFLLGRP